MAITQFISSAEGRARNILRAGLQGSLSHALGRNSISGTSSSKHAPLTRPTSYSSTRLQFPFNVESDPHQGHYIIFDIKKYKPAKTKKRYL